MFSSRSQMESLHAYFLASRLLMLQHPVFLRPESHQQMIRLLEARQDQSGDVNRQLSITKKGSGLLRTLLTECAQVVLKDGVRATDLKLKGLRICERGGANSRKRAVTAVVRGLAVTMAALLKHPEREYVPLSEAGRKAVAEAMA